ncbi:hypothetical protein FIBSPDRAFT_926912 [Athelia psychrophila]|uniref:Uncharacterized protein n=1 Tax=Athelia psychrophila TaxID=1759441 RepID=A0A166SSP7_9AGAM|nr:hypothetical protein FIBSPDRAFT_926912 [Fibularhizoctonia sp. CBS 109695]
MYWIRMHRLRTSVATIGRERCVTKRQWRDSKEPTRYEQREGRNLMGQQKAAIAPSGSESDKTTQPQDSEGASRRGGYPAIVIAGYPSGESLAAVVGTGIRKSNMPDWLGSPVNGPVWPADVHGRPSCFRGQLQPVTQRRRSRLRTPQKHKTRTHGMMHYRDSEERQFRASVAYRNANRAFALKGNRQAARSNVFGQWRATLKIRQLSIACGAVGVTGAGDM